MKERERENEHSSFKGNISTANQNERRKKNEISIVKLEFVLRIN
jgi:hypothetical protein